MKKIVLRTGMLLFAIVILICIIYIHLQLYIYPSDSNCWDTIPSNEKQCIQNCIQLFNEKIAGVKFSVIPYSGYRQSYSKIRADEEQIKDVYTLHFSTLSLKKGVPNLDYGTVSFDTTTKTILRYISCENMDKNEEETLVVSEIGKLTDEQIFAKATPILEYYGLSTLFEDYNFSSRVTSSFSSFGGDKNRYIFKITSRRQHNRISMHLSGITGRLLMLVYFPFNNENNSVLSDVNKNDKENSYAVQY